MPEYRSISEHICTVSGFFTPEECAACIAHGEARRFKAASINTAFGPQVNRDVRSNSRVILDDPAWSVALWQRAIDFVPLVVDSWQAIGLNERFRLYRYDIGEQFDWHLDAPYERENGERSRLTFMIYLNDDFSGGQTTIEEVTIQPQQGLALIFAHDLLHKGQPVVEGRKYVARTDVMYRRQAV